MAKKFAVLLLVMMLASCSKNKDSGTARSNNPDVETFPIENAELKNCHFKEAKPLYSFNAKIVDNPILCDEGVPLKVERLTPAELPKGLEFAKEKLSLVGTPTEKLTNAPYDFYLENEAGYVVIRLQITVK